MSTTIEMIDLCGRDAECERIEALLDEARGGRSAVLIVVGEAGVGKSALLDEACRRAGGMQVLRCRGIESEARLPFAALHQLLRPVLAHAQAIPPVQAHALHAALGMESDVRPERFLVAIAVLSLLAEAAATAPLLCLVDDAHWLDEASATTLAFAARRLVAEPVAMLFAVRDGEDARLDPLGLPQLRLGGLDSAAAGALLDRAAGGELSPDARDRLTAATAGNPLALLELSAAMTDEQRAGTAPILGPLPVSKRVERAFLRRVRRLPGATQTLLLAAAADEGGELAAVLEAAARLGIAAEALDAAEEAGLVRVHGTTLELRHPLLRSAVYHGAPLSQRLAVHAAYAAVLDGEATADRRAWHRAAASVEPDSGVVHELEQAARRAQARGGYDAASLALERAAALTLDGAERARLLAAAAENAWLPGQATRARTLITRAYALTADPVLRSELDRLAGHIELTCGVPGDSAQMLLRAGRRVATADPERSLYLLSLASWGAAFARDPEAIVAIADAAEALAVPDTPANRFLMTRLQGLRAHFVGDFEDAAAKLQATLELAASATSDDLADRFSLASPVGLFLCDDRGILALHRGVAARARERGAVTLLAQATPWVALGEIWTGRWPAAAARLDEGLELARASGQHQITAHLVALQGMLAALRGDEERCRARTAEALEQASARGLVHVASCATWALAILELSLGRPDAALAHARALPVTAGIEWDALDRIEAAVRWGDAGLARAWLEAFEPWAEASAAPWGKAVALHGRALLAPDLAEADRLFRAALAAQDAAARPFERARTELAFGELLRRARRRTEARRRLRAALERFEALGADLWAERARVELRASGERSRRRDPSTLDDLTPQEIQIAQLVAQGGTNRAIASQLFLSPRTIDFHLRNVFRKLGISSRIELARLELVGAQDPG
jgi:DNA-binding CsgD family transcriptional regulator